MNEIEIIIGFVKKVTLRLFKDFILRFNEKFQELIKK